MLNHNIIFTIIQQNRLLLGRALFGALVTRGIGETAGGSGGLAGCWNDREQLDFMVVVARNKIFLACSRSHRRTNRIANGTILK